MKKYNVLITTSGSVTAQGVIKGLRKQNEFDCRLITTDIIENTPGKHISDKFYLLPNEKSDEYISSLKKICIDEKIDVIIPIHDQELMKIAENAQEFKDLGCTLVLSSKETIEKCNDKYKTYEFFLRNKVKTPLTYRAEEVINGIQKIDFPAFLKPAKGVSAIGTYVVESMDELRILSKKIKEPLVQTLYNGREYSVDVLCDFNSKLIGAVPRSRDARNQGACIKGVTEKDDFIIKECRRIAEDLKIIGPANIQCFKQNGEIIFFDVNPRFSATHAHTIMAGMNTPHLILKIISGQKVDSQTGNFKDKLQMYRYWSEIYVDEENNLIKGDSLIN